MTPMSVGGEVTCALTRLLRPEADPMIEVLDAWPLTVADVLGNSGPEPGGRRSAGGGFSTALERLLRPDRQLMLLAIDAFDPPAGALEHAARSSGSARQRPGSANAA